MMAVTPGAVHMECQNRSEPILPLKRLEHLKGVNSGLWWFADYPDQVISCPSAGSRETGERFIKAMAGDFAGSLGKIKAQRRMGLFQN
jgi:hypothetical protein